MLVRILSLVLLLSGGSVSADEPKPPVRSPHFERTEFAAKDGTKLVYYAMRPPEVRPGERYPLVLALHGRGGNTQAAAVLAGNELRKQYPCFVIAPVADRQHRWAYPKGLQNERLGRRLGRTELMPAVLEAVDAAIAKWPVDADRVYVTGQSMGGFGTFGAIAARPELFAAAVPICGGWDPAEAKRFVDVPLWAFHGSKDSTVEPKMTERVIDALKQAGGTPKFTLYPGVGHNSWSRTYESAATWKWLFDQRLAPKPVESTTEEQP